jgi:hypothetical protein
LLLLSWGQSVAMRLAWMWYVSSSHATPASLWKVGSAGTPTASGWPSMKNDQLTTEGCAVR